MSGHKGSPYKNHRRGKCDAPGNIQEVKARVGISLTTRAFSHVTHGKVMTKHSEGTTPVDQVSAAPEAMIEA